MRAESPGSNEPGHNSVLAFFNLNFVQPLSAAESAENLCEEVSDCLNDSLEPVE